MDCIKHCNYPSLAKKYLLEKYPLTEKSSNEIMGVYSTIFQFAQFLSYREIDEPQIDHVNEYVRKYPPLSYWWYTKSAPALYDFIDYLSEMDYQLWEKREIAREERNK